MKKTYTATVKAQAVWELFKETKTLNQLASEYGGAATVVRAWKLAAIKGLADVFEKRDSVTELKAAHERQGEDRYAEIGRLTTQVHFLKKRDRPEPQRATNAGGARRRGPATHHPG
jgi:putative transposase